MEQEAIELEKRYTSSQAAAALRRLADALEAEKSFYIQIHGQQVRVPPYASVEVEYERSGEEEELEFEIKWKREA